MKHLYVAAAAAAALAWADAAMATTITDAAGDFYTGYTGPQGGDLDVLTTSANIVGGNLVLGATLNGAVTTTPNWQYVWGIDRGTGTARFAAADPGLNGVLFDAVVSIAAGTRAVNLLSPAPTVTQPLAASAVTISGTTIEVVVPLSLLPSTGRNAEDYGINLWPRVSNIAGVAGIADFAPNNGVFSVPEPASMTLLAGGLLGLGLLRHARRRQG